MNQHLVFSQTVTIQKEHIDSYGHMNNAVYLRLFEDARWEFITQRGYGLQKIKDSGLGPVVLEIHLKFLHEIREGESIVIKSQLLAHEGKVSTVRQWMENADGRLCCEAEFRFGLFDLKLRKLVVSTPEWLHAMGFSA